MNNYFISDSQNLNYSFQVANYSYSNIFNATNSRIMENKNNNTNYSFIQNNNPLPKNNSSVSVIRNNYYNTINNYNYNNNIINNNINYNNNNTNKIIIKPIFSRNEEQSPTKNLNYTYQNNILPSNTWVKNGNIFYSPTKLINTKNTVLYNYENLKRNNYQNVTTHTHNSNTTLNFKNFYNINSNNSTSTNALSTASINNNKNNNNNTISTENPPINFNIQKHASEANVINTNSNNRIKTLQIPRKNITNKEKKINIFNLEPKEHFDPVEFKSLKLIGGGSYGKIYLVQWVKNNKRYALKKEPIKTNEIINKRKEKIKLVNDFLKKTKCPGIIKIYGNVVKKEKDEQDYYYFILMELADKDWEKEIIDRKKYNIYYTEKELFMIMYQLISTMALLQKNHITHRDIKPQNILISKGTFKLSDFGEARTLKRTGIIISRVRGTELFMSPVLFHGLKHKLSQVGHNTFKSDVFSLGLCFLLAGSLTFNSLYSIREVNDTKVIEEYLDKYLSERYSIKIIKIILDMLQIDENLRPDFITLEKEYFLKKK
jgi:hypothetical protein